MTLPHAPILATPRQKKRTSVTPSLQLQYGLGRGEGQEPCVLQNTTQHSLTTSLHTASLTRKPAAPMCQRKQLATLSAGQRHPCRPNPPLTLSRLSRPIVHRLMAGCNTARDRTRVCSDVSSTAVPYTVMQCLIPLRHSGGHITHILMYVIYVKLKSYIVIL